VAGPATATVAILTFLRAWNSNLWPLMVVQTESLRPVMVGVSYFQQQNILWGQIMAYSTPITIPVLVFGHRQHPLGGCAHGVGVAAEPHQGEHPLPDLQAGDPGT
jgi:ABC-type maltose transport system permease subunit